MNKGLRNEIVSLLALGTLGALALRRPRLAASLGFAAGATAMLAQTDITSFRSRNVIITGGSRGLGLALAKELIRQGARVCLLARDMKELERAQNMLTMINPQAQVFIFSCDVTKKEQITQAFSEFITRFGKVDMLINNAGSILVGPLDSLTRDDFEAQMKLHVYAPLETIQTILPHFRENKGGRVVNICSLGGKVAIPHMLTYDTSKFALAGLSQGMSAELSRENISITTVYPTVMRTGSPIQAVFKGDHQKEYSWFATTDNMPGFSMAADVAAKKILQGALDRRSELILSTLGKVRVGAAVVLPELMGFTMSLINRLLPRGTSKLAKTGADSSALFENSKWNGFLQENARTAEQDLNQEAKSDAAFNAGLLH